jgi:hypothetical protein
MYVEVMQVLWYYKYTIQGVLCIPIPQLLKYWKIKFATVELDFFLNK